MTHEHVFVHLVTCYLTNLLLLIYKHILAYLNGKHVISKLHTYLLYEIYLKEYTKTHVCMCLVQG